MKTFLEILSKNRLLIIVPLAVFVVNLLLGIAGTKAPPQLGENKGVEADNQRVVRVYEGLRNLNGEGREMASLTKLMLTVWVRNVDGWLHDRVLAYPMTLKDGGYSEADLKAYWDKKPEQRSVVDRDRFNAWLRDCLGQMRLVIGGEVFETIKPDPVLSATEATPDGTPKDFTWTRMTFRHLEPGTEEEAKMRSLVQVYGSECSAPISLAFPFVDSKGQTRYVSMKTLVNEGPPSQMQQFRLPLRSRTMRALAWAALAAVLMFLASVAATTGVLRAPVPESNPLIPGWQESPWSTSRVVFAWWLAICTGCYLFLWAMEGDMNVLSGSAPLLLGINGGTLLAATWLSGRNKAPATSDLQSAGDSTGETLVANEAPTCGFLTDLISEGGETEISKLQLVVWNGLLGVVFIWECLSDWQMPTFNEYLMTLLGISSTAYVGFKAAK